MLKKPIIITHKSQKLFYLHTYTSSYTIFELSSLSMKLKYKVLRTDKYRATT